ncbi:type 1 fimbrial protein [Rahnella woolbedingensis]|uniref:Type 1 fimbrial protein n=2 Tax=Rahnella woolbedingensis TaxID=1510574 RepID=A0A419N828_9GAMM|nr:type 1 fimbrial protein [Rahnella woolbedingensis]
MKFLGLSLLALSASSLSPLAAFAADGDITFIGVVTASACTLNGFNGGTTTSGATMFLPSVTPSSFSSSGGGYAAMTDFTIDLKDCDITTMKNAQVTFSGSPDSVDNAILANNASSPASGVGVAILENNGTKLVDINGGDASDGQALSVGNTSLKFKVAYKANTATPAVTAGNVSAKSFVNVTYY